MTISREVLERLQRWKLEHDEMLKVKDADEELADRHKQSEDQVEQVPTELVEDQVDEEILELRSHSVRNDTKTPQAPHKGERGSMVNLWGLRDFPRPQRIFLPPETRLTQPCEAEKTEVENGGESDVLFDSG